MKRFISILVAVTCAVCLMACGFGGGSGESGTGSATSQGTSITVNKDGSISNSIVEEFGESYYDEDSLKSMIDDAVSQYNSSNADAGISLKSCKVSDGYANVTMEYGGYRAYSGFNGEDFFCGTVTEANMAGYDLNITLKDVSDTTATISKPQLLALGDNHIVIIAAEKTQDGDEIETVTVNTYDEILYVSSGINVTGKKSADVSIASGYGYIVFK